MGKTLYSTAEIGELFMVDRATAFNWLKAGVFPNYQHVGRSYAVPAGDVLRLLDIKIIEAESLVAHLKSVRDTLAQKQLSQ